MKALSLFANVGIAEAYLKEIGIDVVVANEFIEKRAELYQKIYPNTKMVCGDITDNGVLEQIRDACEKSGVDVLMATPPCQGIRMPVVLENQKNLAKAKASAIADVQSICTNLIWGKSQIDAREQEVKQTLFKFFKDTLGL